MADEPTRAPGSLSQLWALLLLPLGLGVGVLMGTVPEPQAPPAPPLTVRTAGAPHDFATTSEPRPQAETGPELSPAAPAPRAQESAWTTFDAAMAESRSTGKPILLDFNAEWCPPCRAMKRQVFENGARARDVQTAVIPVSIVDRRREDGSNPAEVEDLQRRYGIDAFPTLVVLSPATGRHETARGYGGAEATVEWIQRAAAAVR